MLIVMYRCVAPMLLAMSCMGMIPPYLIGLASRCVRASCVCWYRPLRLSDFAPRPAYLPSHCDLGRFLDLELSRSSLLIVHLVMRCYHLMRKRMSRSSTISVRACRALCSGLDHWRSSEYRARALLKYLLSSPQSHPNSRPLLLSSTFDHCPQSTYHGSTAQASTIFRQCAI